eukprot:CAMPEP_0183332954 /NCGR_PEP_ID=MMETSP0164_2-20130417/1998_1 /TAXON_ID=221442 /ORGANISM="Coccolithus pelagicus ssp braarudi, Strain PLY182g" /LENGTH=49 /DNA_ID= /DNA_START= /DNA_END= /DNA_ORIENTATION=
MGCPFSHEALKAQKLGVAEVARHEKHVFARNERWGDLTCRLLNLVPSFV